jgi:uncharacterized membrane protein
MSNKSKPKVQTPQKFSVHQSQFYQGPLPPAQQLQQYEQIQPGFADRILSLTEGEAAHRRQLEAEIVKVSKWATLRGQVFGFVSVIFLCAVCTYALYLGHPTAAAAIAGASMVGMGGAYLLNKQNEKK